MKKKILLSLLAVIALAAGVVGMSAFEAHIINVTAKIENSITVDTTPIDFGNVFPQEAIDEYFSMALSQSFMEQERVDNVSYVIRQKPKCWSETEQKYGLVSEDGDGNFYCADNNDYEILPLLCPFLSKHEMTEDGEVENDSEGINAFHGPINGWVMQDTLDTEVWGRLVNIIDMEDEWRIDFRAPCFGEMCAQDWPDFVLANNPEADPEAYILDPSLEHLQFGCDLWVEVNGISKGEMDPRELACINSGGTVATSMCCEATGDFPDLCSTGACGCAPEFSHEVMVCICGDGECWDGQACVSDGEQCIAEGESVAVVPSALSCCPGLVNISCDSPGQTGECDAECVGATICANCGNGICGLGENKCNCPSDCPACGDGIIDAGEECDDGNNSPGDGCSAVCEVEVINPGDIVINEIMQNPHAVVDTAGEWFEVYNTTGSDIDLNGCVIRDEDSDYHVISLSAVVPAMGYRVLTNNSDPASNGGYTAIYQYPSNWYLANAADEIVIECGGVEIDRVEYDDGITFPDPTGASMILADPSLDNNDASNWCISTTAFGGGDKGTPSQPNDPCAKTIAFSDMGANPQYGYLHDYSGASVNFTYSSFTDNKLTGTITGSGLKPYATYQLKFEGRPVCAGGSDDQGNEDIGYLGRWWNNDTNSNTNDAGYLANSVYHGGSDCIVGYLVWDYVTADSSGNISKAVEADNSYHVLWCSGGTCGSSDNSQLQNLDGSIDPPAFPYCDASDVNGEIERFSCDGLTMPAGSYDLNMILNEESFHQDLFGEWTAVMDSDINFKIY